MKNQVAPTKGRLEALNVGRQQGIRPYPIVDHCPWCAKNEAGPDGVIQADENVMPGDDVVFDDDDDCGLTFMMHAFCYEQGMGAFLEEGKAAGGRIAGLRQELRGLREELDGLERLFSLAERLRLEHDGEFWRARFEAAEKPIGYAGQWLGHAKHELGRFYQRRPPVPGFIEKPWRGPLIELIDAAAEIERVAKEPSDPGVSQ